MERPTWLEWAVRVGLLPNRHETLILAALALVCMVAYHAYTRSWYTERIKAALWVDSMKARQPSGISSSTHDLTPEEMAAIDKELGVGPDESPLTATLSQERLAQKAIEMAHEDLRRAFAPPPTNAQGKTHKVPSYRKFLAGTTQVSATAAASVIAVPASLTGGVVGGVMGVPRGPKGMLTGTLLGATSGGTAVFNTFGLLKKKQA